VGSTFWFTALLELAGAGSSPDMRRQHTDLHGRRVLIVDDNATNRCVLTEQLADCKRLSIHILPC
jgi:hypothetical protein